MAPLQVLSFGLFLVTSPLPLSTLRQSLRHVYRCHRRLEICISSSPSSRPVVNWHQPVTPLSRPSSRYLSTGTDDVQLGALERDSRTWRTEVLPFVDLESGNDLESPTDVLDDDGSEESKNTNLSNDGAQLGASDYVKYVQKNVPTKEVQAPNYLTMSDKELFTKCRMDTYRASGPGGQHRNKTESAVRLTHIPTGLVSQAADDRSQHINRSLALTRLRQVIALEVRDPVELEGYKPSPELVRILPVGTGGKRGNSQKIGPNHPDFVLGMKALMDLLCATRGSVSHAGTTLGLSTGALSKLITSNNLLWQGVNKLRASKGLKALRQ